MLPPQNTNVQTWEGKTYSKQNLLRARKAEFTQGTFSSEFSLDSPQFFSQILCVFD